MRPFLIAVLLLVAPGPTLAAAQAANPLPPGASTEGAADVTQTSATVAGKVDPGGAETTYRFQYGTASSYGLTSATQTLPGSTASVDVRAPLTKLTAGTTYHYRVVATNAAGTTPGADKTFRTASPPSRPGASTEAAKDAVADAVTLQGRVDPNRQATSYVFDYGTSRRYGMTSPAGDAGAGDSLVAVGTRIGGLLANTTYHVRIRATNATGTTTGADRTFRTGKVPLGLTATASTASVRYGGAVTITGTVSGTDRSGVPIVLERRNFPFDTGFRPSGTQQSTDASGVVRFVLPPFTLGSQFRLSAPGRSVVSAPVTVAVRALVRLRVQRLRGGRLRLSGTVSPGAATGTASIQRRGDDGRYRTVRRATLRPGRAVSRFAVLLLSRRTVTTYRVVTHLAGGALSDGRSLPRSVAPR